MPTAYVDSGRAKVETSQETASRERRRHERRLLRAKAFLLLPGQDQHLVRTLDVSISGMAIVSPFNTPQGVVVTVRFLLPAKYNGHTPISSPATVTHCVFSGDEVGFKTGLMFKDLPSQIVSIIESYVKLKDEPFQPVDPVRRLK
jgi:hypothetical protein